MKSINRNTCYALTMNVSEYQAIMELISESEKEHLRQMRIEGRGTKFLASAIGKIKNAQPIYFQPIYKKA